MTFEDVVVLCVGDVMLDRFVSGRVNRISPESPVPVLSVTSVRSLPGGAANVCRNVASLGGRCTLIGVIGDDAAGSELVGALAQVPRVQPRLLTTPRPTTEKTRFVAQGQQLLRTDVEVAGASDADTEDAIVNAIAAALPEHDVLVLSDYAKGVLTPRVVRHAIDAAMRLGIPVVVDPKTSDLSRYAGATIVTPNSRETFEATSINPEEDADAESAARAIMQRHDFQSVLITRAEKGMSLVRREGPVLHLVASAREVFDVAGAGDTVAGTLALAIGAGNSLEDAAWKANVAAGLVVGKRGTATVTHAELLAETDRLGRSRTPASKEMTHDALREHVDAWRSEGLRIGFTNGCFDILHTGHASLLQFARTHCDRLIVAINSDASVRRLKGEGRPVNGAGDRALLLSALAVVDAVAVFDEDTPAEIISLLKPDVLVKGGDYTIDTIVGADTVLARGGEVLVAPLVRGKSTSSALDARRRGARS